MLIAPLAPGSPRIAEIARTQFDHWGALTGFETRAAYEAFLRDASEARDLPTTLVAHASDTLLGSVNVMPSEMTIRPDLMPWMGQLFVTASGRGRGVGTRLCTEALRCAHSHGFERLYLFTSGTLPDYYRARGWSYVKEAEYLGTVRTIMRIDRQVRMGRLAHRSSRRAGRGAHRRRLLDTPLDEARAPVPITKDG